MIASTPIPEPEALEAIVATILELRSLNLMTSDNDVIARRDLVADMLSDLATSVEFEAIELRRSEAGVVFLVGALLPDSDDNAAA